MVENTKWNYGMNLALINVEPTSNYVLGMLILFSSSVKTQHRHRVSNTGEDDQDQEWFYAEYLSKWYSQPSLTANYKIDKTEKAILLITTDLIWFD